MAGVGGHWARRGAATMALQQGKTDEGLQALGALSSAPKLPSRLRVFVLDALATAQMDAGKLEEANKTFTELASVEGGLLADYAALQRGRISEAKGEADTAKATYEAALKDYPEGAFRDEIRKRLDLL